MWDPVTGTPVGQPLTGHTDTDLTQNLIGNFHYMRGVTFENRNWPAARREFTLAAAAAPNNDVLFYNLGLIFRRNGLLDESVAAFHRSAEINPREIASLSRPVAADRVRELEGEARRLSALETQLVAGGSLSGLSPSSSAYHRGLAGLADERGEAAAARGHRLRAEEGEAGH